MKTSLHLEFITKIKYPEALNAYKSGIYNFRPLDFDASANKKEQTMIKSMIYELINNNENEVLIDCMPVAITQKAQYVLVLDAYDLNITRKEIQNIIKKHYLKISNGESLHIKLNNDKSEFQIEMTSLV